MDYNISATVVVIILILCDIVTQTQTNTKVQDFAVYSKAKTCIYVRWKCLTSTADQQYDIEYSEGNSTEKLHNISKRFKCKKWLKMTDYFCGAVCSLKDNREYSLRIGVHSNVTSVEYSDLVNTRTIPERPSPPRNLNYTLDEKLNFLLSWEHPLFPNGIIKGFFITLNNFTTEIQLKSKKEVSPVYNYTVKSNDVNNSSLFIRVITYNLAGNSTAVEYSKHAIPPLQPMKSHLNILLAVFPLLLFLTIISIICCLIRSKRKSNETDTLSTSGYYYLSPDELQEIRLLEKVISPQKLQE